MENWKTSVTSFTRCLDNLQVRDAEGRNLLPESAFCFWTDTTSAVRATDNTIYLIGNGASASMSSHLAADLAKNAHVHTEVFSDLSLLTAIADDLGYDQVFSEPIRRRMKTGDMLVAVSSSGESPNVLRAAETALERGGHVVTLSGMKDTNSLSMLGTLNFHVPATTYGLAETCHAAILHHWMDRVALTMGAHLFGPGAASSDNRVTTGGAANTVLPS